MCERPERLICRSSSSSGVDAIADDAALPGERRRLVFDRGGNGVPDVGDLVELAAQALDERRDHGFEDEPQARDGRERLPQRHEISRAGRAERRPGDEALEIVHRPQRVAHPPPLGHAVAELLHGVEPILNAFERDQRTRQPRAQQPRAHGRLRPIQHRQQRPLAPATRAFEHLEVANRHRVDEQRVAALAPADGAHVREIHLLRVAQVGDQRAGGARRRRSAVESVGVEAARLELFGERPVGTVIAERPRLDQRDRKIQPCCLRQQRCEVGALRRDDLPGAQDLNFLVERLPSRVAGVFGGEELARGHVEQRHADRTGIARTSRAISRRGDRETEGRLARIEIAGIGERARRDDARHLALDHTFGLLRILDLIADRDPEASPDEPADVAIGGVEGHAAHRHRVACRVLRPRRERQLERPRRRQRVLVEHLVEVAHPEEQDGVAILPLGVEILPHGRRDRSGGGRRRNGRGHGAGYNLTQC